MLPLRVGLPHTARARASLARGLSHWILAAVTVGACAGTNATPSRVDGAPAAQTEQREVVVTEGTEFTLRAGGSGRLAAPAIGLRFERVDSDSRCPVDTTCIWAGDAIVRLSLDGAASRESAVLHTNPDFERSVVFLGHRITLVRLMPLPRDGQQIPQVDYEATFVIVKS